MVSCCLGVDVGSRSVRCVAVAQAQLLAQAEQPVDYEVDPRDPSYITASQSQYWQAISAAVRDVVRKIGASASISGVCVDATCSLAVCRVLPGGTEVPQAVDSAYSGENGIVFWMDHRSKGTLAAGADVSKLGGVFIPEMAVPKARQILKDGRCDLTALRMYDLHDWIESRLVGGNYVDEIETNGDPIGIDGSLRGFSKEFLETCGITGLDRVFEGPPPFAGQKIGDLCDEVKEVLEITQSESVPVYYGLIDCYAGFFATFPHRSEAMTNTMLMVAGTSACFLAVSESEKPAQPGIWGGFQIVPDLWFYEGGISCCGVLIEQLFGSHPCGKDMSEPGFWENWENKVDEHCSDLKSEWLLNARRFYSGDYLGNRTPYNDSQVSAYLIGGTMIQNEADLVSKYLLILEYIALETRLMMECFVKGGFPLKYLTVTGSLAKNRRLLKLLQIVLHSSLDVDVVTASDGVDDKFRGAYGSALLSAWGNSGKAEFTKIDALPDPKVAALMDIKYRSMKQMIQMQRTLNDAIDKVGL